VKSGIIVSTGNTYKCNFEKRKGVFRLWLVDFPRIEVISHCFFEAEELLWDKIREELNDAESHLDYVKKLPQNLFPRRYSSPLYFFLDGAKWGQLGSNIEDVIIGGKCNVCENGFGSRTEEPIVLETYPKNTELIILDYRISIKSCIVSSKLAEELSLNKNFILKPVVSKKETDIKFYELIPQTPSFVATPVAVKKECESLGRYEGWRCSECGYETKYYFDGVRIKYILNRNFLDNNIDVFLLDGNLCVSSIIMSRLRENKSLKNIGAMQIGFALDEDIDKRAIVEIK